MRLASLRTRIKVAAPSKSEHDVMAYREQFDHVAFELDLLPNGWVSVKLGNVQRLVPPDAVAWVTVLQEPVVAAVAGKVVRK